LAKKYNKGRTQKPNYSKRGMTNPQVEISRELNPEEKDRSLQDKSICMNKSNNKNQC